MQLGICFISGWSLKNSFPHSSLNHSEFSTLTSEKMNLKIQYKLPTRHTKTSWQQSWKMVKIMDIATLYPAAATPLQLRLRLRCKDKSICKKQLRSGISKEHSADAASMWKNNIFLTEELSCWNYESLKVRCKMKVIFKNGAVRLQCGMLLPADRERHSFSPKGNFGSY